MTPDTLPIDLVFPGVGRIHKRSGTTSAAVREKIKRALRELYSDGELEVLRAVRDGVITPMEAYDAHRRHAVKRLPIGGLAPLVSVAMKRWIDDAEAADEYSTNHLNNLRTALNHFEKVNPKARVADLPQVLEQLRATFGVKHARSFNLAREAASAFVRSTLKRNHPLWLDVRAVEARSTPRSRVAEAKKPTLLPDDARTAFPHPETNKVDAVAWSMLTTGMGSKEYWGRWETKRDRVHIHGTKRGGRVRDVPLIQAPAVPRLSRDRFEKNFRERFGGKITPYDLRRTYARWLELAKVPRTRRRLYMGHGAKDVTDLYEAHEVTRFLEEDGKTLRAYLGLPEITATPARLA